ncbi:MAG: hypothetical protein SF187_04030 [Deltaproteobacteria bacterium]|nr:hypothetical protein [Deltaproteobacteria bacterium]
MIQRRNVFCLGAMLLFSACSDNASQVGDGGTTSGDGGPDVPVALGGNGVAGNGGGGGATGGATVADPQGSFTLGAPRQGTDWNADPKTGAGAPQIVYPSNQTRFPRNIYRTLFQWKATGNSEYRLIFTGPGTTVTVFTDGVHPLCAGKAGTACWEADESSWHLIADGNAGRTVSWIVDGLDTSGAAAVVKRSDAVTLGFSLKKVEGAIFYWSTTSAGIRRANVSAAEPENYIAGKPATTYASPTDSVKCVACHVVSRDGKFMLAPVQAASGGGLWIMEVTRAAPPTPLVKNVANTGGHGFATISPDNENVVAAWGGKMWMLDRVTGTKKMDLPLGATLATHPDWSPNGTQVVFSTGKGDSPAAASLAVIPFMNGAWGAVKVLLAATATTKPVKGMPPPPGGSNLFPMHSPDSQWIAFSRGKGGHGDLSAQLWVMPSAGGAPIELVNANRVVSNAMGDGLTENSQPTWAPSGDLLWVAFNSQREYGVVSPAGRQQIWVAAIDPEKLGTNEDPSFPAFRLQFQGLNEDNHRAFWTLDVRDPPTTPPPPTPDAGMCVTADQKCDPVADTCCDSTLRCDSVDDGATYTCMRIVL